MSKPTGLSLLKLLCLCLILILNACSNEEKQVKELTFEDIEKKFGFERPLTAISRANIIKKYETTEYYREVLENNILRINKHPKELKAIMARYKYHG